MCKLASVLLSNARAHVEVEEDPCLERDEAMPMLTWRFASALVSNAHAHVEVEEDPCLERDEAMHMLTWRCGLERGTL